MFIKRARYEHLIAENKRLEEALREAEDRFENFLKNLEHQSLRIAHGRERLYLQSLNK